MQEIPQRQSFFRPELPLRQSTVARETLPPWQQMARESIVRVEARPPELRPSVNLYTSSPVKEIKEVKEIPIYYNQKSAEIIPNPIQSVTSLMMAPK